MVFDGEDDMTKPIVSCSFGNTVIFLLGDTSRAIPPTAFYIRSGDVIIMAGQSRYCYHGSSILLVRYLLRVGVPRMIANTLPDYLSKGKTPPEWRDLQNILKMQELI